MPLQDDPVKGKSVLVVTLQIVTAIAVGVVLALVGLTQCLGT